MQYVIMCGGDYVKWEKPRQLSKVCGEELVARTIRLLKANGIPDIAISSNHPAFEKFGVPVLKHDNLYIANGFGNVQGDWFNAFYPMDEPACYLFGDVVFSPEAIKRIIETETDDIQLFGSKPPFAKEYHKNHEEPFALKVVNQKHLKEAIEKTRELDKQHKFWRKPIVWELFTVIKNAPLQVRKNEYTADYVGINDYTVDIDFKEDIMKINKILGGINMVKCETIENFTLSKYDELRNVVKKGTRQPDNFFTIGDTFECDEDMAKYLTGGNAKNKKVVKILEIIPAKVIKEEVKEEPKVEVKKTAAKTTKKKTSKK